MEFVCKRCGFQGHTKARLLQHLKRKNPCNVSLENIDIEKYELELKSHNNNDYKYICELCNKSFANSKCKYQHKIRCKRNSNKDEISITKKEYLDLKNQIKNINIELLQNQIKQLQDQIKNNKSIVATQNNTNNGNVTNITNTIVLRNFGDENLDILDEESMIHKFIYCDIVGLIRDLHFDPDHPENHNLDYTKSVIKRYRNGKWVNSPWKQGICDLIMSKVRILETVPVNLKDRIERQEDEYTIEEFEESAEELAEIKYEAQRQNTNADIYNKVENYFDTKVEGKDYMIQSIIEERELMSTMIKAEWIPTPK